MPRGFIKDGVSLRRGSGLAGAQERPVRAQVGTRTPVEQVRVVPAVEGVGSVLSEQAVVLDEAGEDIVPIPSVQNVQALEPEEIVLPVLAEERVVPEVAREQRVVP